MRFVRPFLLAVVPLASIAVAVAQYPGAVPPPAELKKGFDAISIRKAKSILTFLATKCEGRGTGQPGFQKAADFVADKFRTAGLKPMGDNGTYFQKQTFYRTFLDDIRFEDGSGKSIFKREFVLNPTNHDIDVRAPIVVVRASDATSKLSDIDAGKLDGKIVVEVLPPGRSAAKTQVALASTSAVILVVEGTPITAPAVRRTAGVAGSIGVNGRVSHRALAQISPQVDQFVTAPLSGAALFETGTEGHLTAKTKSESVLVPNVVGLLEGSDTVLKNEYIGVGGHLDHLGVVNGVVFPGADDDGSGSTSVMLIADAMARNPEKPKRSILFMTFFGEEMGLLGSSFLSDHPPVPLNKMVAELQMDMVARDSFGAQNGDPNRMDKVEENIDTIRLVGSKRISTDLDRTIQEVNASVGFRFRYDAEDVYTRSDHYNFAKHGIPIAFLFDGFTPSYHQPTDTVDTIDFAKLTNAAKLYYLTAYAIANTPQAPRHDVGR